MKLYNMTQHSLQTSQIAQAERLGYTFIESERLNEIKKKLCNLNGFENLQELSQELILACLYEVDALVFPIGSPLFYMEFAKVYSGALAPKLLFSHTMRETIETPLPDGSVEKRMVFNHKGFHIVEPDKVPVYHAL